MCEDYRATYGVDFDMDRADFAAGRKIGCRLLMLWGATGGGRPQSQILEIWPRYAADIRGGKALPCGHYLSEEAPEETYRELREFFAQPAIEGAKRRAMRSADASSMTPSRSATLQDTSRDAAGAARKFRAAYQSRCRLLLYPGLCAVCGRITNWRSPFGSCR